MKGIILLALTGVACLTVSTGLSQCYTSQSGAACGGADYGASPGTDCYSCSSSPSQSSSCAPANEGLDYCQNVAVQIVDTIQEYQCQFNEGVCVSCGSAKGNPYQDADPAGACNQASLDGEYNVCGE